MRKNLLFAALAIAIASSAILAPAKALTVEMPADFIDFPRCAVAEVTEMCVESFEVDDNNDGEFDAIPSGDDL